MFKFLHKRKRLFYVMQASLECFPAGNAHVAMTTHPHVTCLAF